jgi:hypothetical protein
MDAKKTEPQAPPPPFILLKRDADGGWRWESNVKNPERILRIVGAQMVLRHEE